MIPISRPLLGPEEEAAVLAVLRSGKLAQGEEVEQLEQGFAELCGVRHGVAVTSGTTALFLALLAHEIGPDDEVITTPFSFVATANSILMTGARPVFVDIDEDCFNLNVRQIEAAITPRTRAIMPVHLYGHPAEMDAIMVIARRNGLAVIEDAAQAVGARYRGRPTGNFSTACFSLYATKNITSGEGGMITTDDDAIAEKLRLLRNHGSRVRYYHECLGYNCRMTDLHAAIGRVQLGKCEAFTAQRIANAQLLNQMITHPQVIKPQVRPGIHHVFHQYTVRILGDRDAAAQQLAAAGVGTAIFYPLTIPNQPVYRELGYQATTPVADRISGEILALPVHPGLTSDEVHQIARAVNALQIEAPFAQAV
ncbi:DegT/DnrJ/EryC1/StrS family aminotransferase [Candidatus Chloroploca sp. M-50]|uniref:DegT/DnrJ/EryC1/StrS family aminotransferase n=1 Tax=Candidatus Chloroploca mongolica TaxID=2528176 RepID=A0ABS4DBL8_9CHLR|nr:DegT/DnrJ/EryC1/StrS family aminotransferase [Candidatus Chloroploca mongolica]MBP1466832.1 DegT/DnrJ/EryC1/StrS family aminotransferase [Candidatus Chloroploca mongolica]